MRNLTAGLFMGLILFAVIEYGFRQAEAQDEYLDAYHANSISVSPSVGCLRRRLAGVESVVCECASPSWEF